MKTEDLQKLVDRLNGVMPNGVECPMCHGHQFTVVDGMFPNAIQRSLDSIQIGGPSIPCIAIICTRCGFMSQHAMGVLEPESIKNKQSGGK